MNRFDFDKSFRKLCENYSKKEEDTKNIGIIFYENFKYLRAESFDNAIKAISEDTQRYDKFPTVAEVKKYVRLVRDNQEERELPDCPVCLPKSGMVLMLIAIKAEKQQDDCHKDIHVEHRYNTFQNRQNMQSKYKDTNVRVYKWAFYCRCQRGQYYRGDDRNNIEINQRDFNEIKEYLKTKKEEK